MLLSVTEPYIVTTLSGKYIAPPRKFLFGKQAMDLKKIIQNWVEAFNRGDADEIAEFYAENAVNHQVAVL